MSKQTLDSTANREQSALADLEAVARRLRLSALDVLWRQWRAVDAQAAGKDRAHAMVDPEALALMSLTLMDDERRLGDLVHGWARRNSGILSVQRVKNLAPGYPERTRERLVGFARIALMQGKDMRWRSISTRATGKDAPIASLRRNKERALRVRLASPAALLLRLRLGLGVGVKADILGYLLGIAGKWASVRDIASATGYTVGGIRRAVEDMATARLIHSAAGPPAAFRADPAAWSRLLALAEDFPAWRYWHQRFAFVAAFLSWIDSPAAAQLTAYTAGVRARELMEQHRSAFTSDLVAAWSEHTPAADWAAFVTNALTALARWMPEHA